MADEKSGWAAIRESIRQAWAEISRPYPTDEELEHMEIERRALWRKVEQLERENAALRRDAEAFARVAMIRRNKLRANLTDLDRDLLDFNNRLADSARRRWSSRDDE